MQGPTPPAGPLHPGSDGERVHVAEGIFRLAVGDFGQVFHEVFAVVSEEVVNIGGVLTGAEGAEVFIAVVAIRVHGFLLWSFDGGMRTHPCSLPPKVRGTPDKIRGYTARAGENTQKILRDKGFSGGALPRGCIELIKAFNMSKQPTELPIRNSHSEGWIENTPLSLELCWGFVLIRRYIASLSQFIMH